jgi:hypothetical protein
MHFGKAHQQLTELIYCPIQAILHQEQPFYMEYHKMTKPQIKEYNCETGIETIRDATDVEIAQIEIDAANAAARKAEADARAATRAALLTRLGITEEEARILLGGN